MTRLLLDFPWTIDEGLGFNPLPYQVILDFLELLRKTGLGAVPFIDHAEQEAFWAAIKNRKGSDRFATVIRLLNHCKSDGDGDYLACPLHEPTNPILRDSWKRALRNELEVDGDWRSPQIVYPQVRKSAWPNTDEIDIKCDDRDGTISRVLVSLEEEEYGSHKYAIPDIDPWRHLEWLKRPRPGARVNYPCRLPKPPILEGVSIEQLPEKLAEARRIGWKVKCKVKDDCRYYFIPPEDFNPASVDQHVWRKGSAFKPGTKKDTNKGIKTGPVDYEGRIWSFDIHEERHWDVQLPDGGKLDISHDGHLVHPT